MGRSDGAEPSGPAPGRGVQGGRRLAGERLGVLAGRSRTGTTWVVRGQSGDTLEVVLRHPNGGVDRAQVTLP
ncbi:MAG: hypothetical protein V5A48_11140 [Salinivenus sp.]